VADSAPALVNQVQNLRTFVYVAEAESVVRAAETLFKAPSAITRSILELERGIGVTLFERKPRGMLLNTYGKAVLTRARRIHQEVQQAAEAFLGDRTKAASPLPSAITSMLYNGRKLQLLISVASLRTISSAAAQLNMTQAGVSMALARIESALGQSLFHRRMEGMIATDLADRLVLHAKRIFAELRAMMSDVAAISGTVSGSVVIGTTPLGRTHLLLTAIAEVLTEHPELSIMTAESSYEQLIGDLRSGELDLVLGVLRHFHLCQGLVTEPLFDDRFAVMVRKGHPLARRNQLHLADLVQEKWILPRPRSLGRPLIESAFRKFGLPPPKPVVQTGDLDVIRRLLSASDMLAVTSPNQLFLELGSGLIVELPGLLGETKREVGLVLREGAMLSPAAKAVIEAVRRRVRQIPQQEP
jgi:LysR family transcriptional regulator of gallate degradation